MSIPVNIEDPTVLRRTLEELEDSIPEMEVEIKKVDELPATATLADVISQVNTIGERLNIVISTLNSTLR